MVGKLEAVEDVVGFTPTRIVENNLSLIMSLINTLSLSPPFFFLLITTPFVLLRRDLKGKEIKVSLSIFILFPNVRLMSLLNFARAFLFVFAPVFLFVLKCMFREIFITTGAAKCYPKLR